MNKKAILIVLFVIFGSVLVSGCIGESESNEAGSVSGDRENVGINVNENPGPSPMDVPENTPDDNDHDDHEGCSH